MLSASGDFKDGKEGKTFIVFFKKGNIRYRRLNAKQMFCIWSPGRCVIV